jgi:hypothetical protein
MICYEQFFIFFNTVTSDNRSLWKNYSTVFLSMHTAWATYSQIPIDFYTEIEEKKASLQK